MNGHLLRNWRRRVGADDTIICLGDVGHPDAWRDDGLVLDVAECPGERLLVLGNHDRDVPALRRALACGARLGRCAGTGAVSSVPLPAVVAGEESVDTSEEMAGFAGRAGRRPRPRTVRPAAFR